jgi:hypothetical protein
MHRRGHPRAGPPRLQRQHPFALPSCVSASVLEALPTGQDHIRYSQPKSNQHQPHKSQFHKSVCVWSQKGGLTTLRWAMARSARACLLRRLLFSSCRHDGFGSLAVLGVLDVGKSGSWEVGKLGPVTHCVRARLGKSNSTASVRARQENASYSNAAGRCQKVEPGRRRGPRICQQKTGLWEFLAERRKARCVHSQIARESPPEPGWLA